MTEKYSGKLKKLNAVLPEGFVTTAAWLDGRGYSGSLRYHYVQSGWLEQPARGVYRRPGRPLRWEQVAISLQCLLDYPLIVGGRTALELQGMTHAVSENIREIHLYGDVPLPNWVTSLSLEQEFIGHNSQKIFGNKQNTRHLTSVEINGASAAATGTVMMRIGVQSGELKTVLWGDGDWPLTVSSGERAILELLDELPVNESFHAVDEIAASLTNLSPRRLQNLLMDCRSVKVKRLFLFFAERHNLPALRHIETDLLDLGAGDRQLVKGGRYVPRFGITVPKDLDDLP